MHYINIKHVCNLLALLCVLLKVTHCDSSYCCYDTVGSRFNIIYIYKYCQLKNIAKLDFLKAASIPKWLLKCVHNQISTVQNSHFGSTTYLKLIVKVFYLINVRTSFLEQGRILFHLMAIQLITRYI